MPSRDASHPAPRAAAATSTNPHGCPLPVTAEPAARLVAVAAYLHLARPSDTALAFVGTFIGAGLAGVREPLLLLVVGAVGSSNALLSAASMMLNDWHDVREDRINRPDRPIPSGAVRRGRALVMSVTLFLLGFALAVLAGVPFGLGAATVIGLSVAYTSCLKPVPLLGNSTAALLSAYPLWCWILVAGFNNSLYLSASLGFVIAGIGKEVIRTAADTAGDAASGIRTVATMRGAAAANRIGAVVIAVALLVGWLPVFLGDAGPAYTMALAFGTFASVSAGPGYLNTGREREASRRLIVLARTITVLMVCAIAWDVAAAGWLLR